MTPPKPSNEEARLEALRSYEILDTSAEQEFDDLARIASTICDTKVALVTLVDDDRQWFKASLGVDFLETSREYAFCAYTILGNEPLVVEDATADARFRDNPMVVDDPGIRFYAGAPLTTSDGFGLGSLCVIDTKPRQLTDEQREALEALARQAIALMELRRTAARLAAALREVRELKDLVPVCSYCRRIRSDDGYWGEVEQYLERQAGARATHGMCPECYEKEIAKIDGEME